MVSHNTVPLILGEKYSAVQHVSHKLKHKQKTISWQFVRPMKWNMNMCLTSMAQTNASHRRWWYNSQELQAIIKTTNVLATRKLNLLCRNVWGALLLVQALLSMSEKQNNLEQEQKQQQQQFNNSLEDWVFKSPSRPDGDILLPQARVQREPSSATANFQLCCII